MRLNFKFSIILLLWSITKAYGQDRLVKYLSVGDTLPSINLKLINANKPQISTADLKGKLVILDFWATWCVPCVAQFPHLSEIQNKFKDKLVILPVAIDGTEKSNLNFYNQRKKQGQEIKLPSVVEDTLLRKFFYFNTVPHEVWIDENGIVLAITDHLAVTDSIVGRVIDKKPVTLSLKYIDPRFDKYKPFLVGGNGGPDTSFIARSILSTYKPQIRGAAFVDPTGARVFLANRTIGHMYTILYSALMNRNKDASNLPAHYLPKKIINESSKKERFNNYVGNGKSAQEFEAYKQSNFFCYELILPKSYNREKAIKKAIKDLDAYWDINTTIEKRKVPCLALIHTSTKDKIRSDGKLKYEKYENLENDSLKIANRPLGWLAMALTIHGTKLPIIIDETGYNNNVDIKISFPKISADMNYMNKQLAKYGLTLVQRDYYLDMLVIKD